MKMFMLNMHKLCIAPCVIMVLANASNPKTQARKGLISYYKTHGITSLRKHVDKNDAIVF